MAVYHRILVALDFTPVAKRLIDRARPLVEVVPTQLLLVHVVEYLLPVDPSGDLMVAPVWDVDEKDLVATAERQLAALADRYGMSECYRKVLIGSPKAELTEHAREQRCDLIVVGSHGRHGIGRLLGSTADAVLHRAHCDVLAVRAGESEPW